VNIVLELTKREQEIFDEVLEKIDETAAFLAGPLLTGWTG
jgi:hypothetical protein